MSRWKTVRITNDGSGLFGFEQSLNRRLELLAGGRAEVNAGYLLVTIDEEGDWQVVDFTVQVADALVPHDDRVFHAHIRNERLHDIPAVHCGYGREIPDRHGEQARRLPVR